MKKYYFFAGSVILLVVLINLYLIGVIQKKEISFQRNILLSQSENCAVEIEKSVSDFQNNINKILFHDDLSAIFHDGAYQEKILNKLQSYYSAYNGLITNISIYDQERNVLNLYQDQHDNFIINPYLAQRQIKLEEKDKLIYRDSLYHYILPVFKENIVAANVIVTVDLRGYIRSFLSKYAFEPVLKQEIINSKGHFILKGSEAANKTDVDEMLQNITNGQKGFTDIQFISDQKKTRYYSAYQPVFLIGEKFGIIFSVNSRSIFRTNMLYIILSSLFSILIILFLLFYFLRIVSLKHKHEITINNRLKELRLILENAPIGLILLDSNRKIKSINKTARDLLFIKKEEDVSDLNISSRFMIARNYFNTGEESGAFDSNQFILYQQEGNEVIVYKRDTGIIVNGEDTFIEAFIDVTSIEKSRKYEAAANNAKSEFLAKMSHEIRTPMNGIIGMTDALEQDNLTPSQKEYLQIVSKSADLLLSIIDDILDFTKIESGKMQLEEIPFRLSEELKLCIDLFKPIIEEKHIHLEVHVDKQVPDHIIGDPFRLRQVISNLLSNSVKFTHQGRIVISVSLEESYDGNVTLQFSVEDTGVGIPKHKLESIFNTFTQADESTSRKYGGSGLGTTIAKQLVNLMHGEIWVESPSRLSKDPNNPGTKFTFTIEVYTNEPLKKSYDFSKITTTGEVSALIISKSEESKNRLITFLDLYDIKHKYYKYQDDKTEKLNDLLKTNLHEFNLIILLDGANFNAIELARYLKDHQTINNFLVFVISNNHKPDNFILSKRAGVDYYFTHPFEQEEFIEGIYDHFPNIKRKSLVEERTIKPDLSILVAEDNEINQKVAETIFSNLGYQIDIAPDGKIAVEMVQKKNYDIIFMDILMPEKDGVQATVDIRGMGVQVPIVAMTATEGKKGRNKAITSGMNDYIVKPVKSDEIKKVLYKWFS